MPVTIGVPRETFPGERRVALTPRACDAIAKLGASVVVEQSAGVEAGYPDDQYLARGARLASRAEVFAQSDIVVQVRTLGANPEAGRADLSLLRSGQIVIGFGEPLTAAREEVDLARAGVSYFRHGAGAAHHARAEHGRALFHGDYRRLSRRAAGRYNAAENVSDVDDRRWNHHRGARFSSSGRASRACKPSRWRGVWARWSPLTTCAPR